MSSKYGVIKFQAPFEKIRENESSPEVKLYKAIILQAIIDASNVSEVCIARKVELEAKNWLFGKSKELYDICNRAGMELDYVMKIAKRAIKMNRGNSSLKSMLFA